MFIVVSFVERGRGVDTKECKSSACPVWAFISHAPVCALRFRDLLFTSLGLTKYGLEFRCLEFRGFGFMDL